MTTFTVDLPDETAAWVRAEAEAQGVNETDLLRTLVEQRYATASAAATHNGSSETGTGAQSTQQTLAEALAGRIGVIDSSKTNGGRVSHLSEDEQAFGDHLEQKRRESRL